MDIYLCWEMTKDCPVKRLLLILIALVACAAGCGDIDMSGFGHIGYTMQYRTPPVPTPPARTPQSNTTELAHIRNSAPAPTP